MKYLIHIYENIIKKPIKIALKGGKRDKKG
jgi:hypothetical protein